MAQELDKETLLRQLADSTGIIFDRTLGQERPIGQAWLVSKSRVVCLASQVSNYADAPWALSVKFPHPDITMAVKAIGLHPDFDRRAFRSHYLTKASNLNPQPMDWQSDLATMTLDADMSPPPPERIAELNRALSIPLEVTTQELSGVMRPGDGLNVMQSTVMSGRPGVVLLMDARSVPFAHLKLRSGKIVQAKYGNIINERAVLELLWKKPGGTFVFRNEAAIALPDTGGEIAMGSDQLLAEAQKRLQEMPGVIDALGGPDARLNRTAQSLNAQVVSPANQWIAERLWTILDGYITITKLSEKIPSDTYSILRTIWELKNAGLVAPVTGSPFHGNGQLGPFYVPAQDMDISFGQLLNGFFLDPVSWAPVVSQGTFYGSAGMLNNKTLLHTAPIPADTAAAVMKDGKLIGLHSGPYVNQAQSQQTQQQLYQMTWIGALHDSANKRLKTEMAGETEAPADLERDQMTSQRGSLRMRASEDRFEDEEPLVAPTGPMAMLLERFTKAQLAAAAGGFGLLAVVFLAMASCHGPQQPTTKDPVKPSKIISSVHAPETDGEKQASKVAQEVFHFKADPPSGFKYDDTSEFTKPNASFGWLSDRGSMKILFTVWPNIGPLENLQKVMKVLPFFEFHCADNLDRLQTGQTERFKWSAGKYYVKLPPVDKDAQPKEVVSTCWAAVYQMPNNPSKCILVEAVPLSDQNIDHQLLSSILDGILFDVLKKSDDGAASQQQFANEAAVAAYYKKVEPLILAQYKGPKVKDTEQQPSISITLNGEGNLNRVEVNNPGDEAGLKALQKAIKNLQPYPDVPKTKSGTVSMVVTVSGDKIKVEEP